MVLRAQRRRALDVIALKKRKAYANVQQLATFILEAMRFPKISGERPRKFWPDTCKNNAGSLARKVVRHGPMQPDDMHYVIA